ncbi:MAG: NAD(P)-dependent dehydrogenase (short-subunit alcohol dehydrogenase family) [Chlamydiales bacterium]|jgi:NAD(P)-dependent dehydrogenase (short-subunit alcohol dehydrogenase family)
MSAPVYLVLGAAGGIGSALCRQLSRTEVRLALAGRNADRLQDLAAELGGSTHVLDATSAQEVSDAVSIVVAEHGRIDGIVNCVGSILLKPAHRTSPEEWRATLAANLDTAFATVRAGASAMMKTGGSIVLLSSAAARTGLANHEAIAAAKAGVVGLALSAAASYAARGIRVNVVSPGLVRTPLSDPLTQNPASEKASLAMHPLGRLGEPGDVARAIAWFLDPEQSWVTGQVLGVDGGLGSIR